MVAVCAAAARAVPACPTPSEVIQPDGAALTLQLHGDEWTHFTTTADGYTVVRHADGGYVYANLDDGAVAATDVMAHNPGERDGDEEAFLSGISKYIHISPESTAGRSGSLKSASAQPKLHGYSTYDLSKLRGLVLLVEYNDCSFTRDDALEVFTNMVTEKDYAGVPSATNPKNITSYTGSVRDYYYENSAGSYDATFDVYGPVQIDYSKTYVKATENARTIMKAACEAADSLVNFADYDSDNDGYVDFVFFIFAGNGSNYTSNDDDLLWPHAWTMTDCKLDGVTLYRYACSVELYGTSSSTLDGIGTICHEYSHVLGLADLYDTDYSESGGTSVHPGYWSVMASGCYCNYGRTPTGYSLYERYALGFASPTVIDSVGEYTMRSLEDYNEGYRINSAVDDEYFLLENRRKSGWNAYTAGSGMLVWRVDSTSATVWENNTVNCNPSHNYYELIRADASSTSTSGSSADPFPGTNNVTSLTNETTPSIASWTGKATPLILTDITESSSGEVTITVAADDSERLVEKFEDIATFSADTTGVAGVFATWDFSGAFVAEVSSSSGNNVSRGYGDHTTNFYLNGSITTTSALVAESIDTIKFYSWNTTKQRTATVHFYYSTDNGDNWNEAYEYGASAATTVSAGTSEQLHVYPVGVAGMPVFIKISVDGSLSSRFISIDNISVAYTGTFGVIGQGTSTSPFLVSNAYEWNALADYMVSQETGLTSQYVKIVNDIDFTGVDIKPLGHDRTVVFDGDLNGNNCTLKGISAAADTSFYGPVAIKTGQNSVIHDLTVEGEVTSASLGTGGVVGQLGGTLQNVTSKANVTSTSSYTAGLAGYATSTGAVADCVNEGSVASSGSYTAGIVGGGYSFSVARCVNNGAITYTGSSTSSYTAGIVGYGQYADIDECVNNGTITTTDPDAGGLAGIMAFAYATSAASSYTSITRCHNTADITSACFNAGILLTGSTSASVAIDSCHNSGDITSTSATAVSSTYTAGIAAAYFRSSLYTRCTNSGDITSASSPYTAGLLGYFRGSALSESSRTIIQDCHNSGNVTSGGRYTGGLVAYVTTYTDIDSCSNSGAVSGGGDYAGGVASFFTGVTSSISGCYNAGDVAGGKWTGGIVGYGASQNSLSTCFNAGNVEASGQYAGGIAGQAATVLTDVYNTGNVTGEDYVGGIAGSSSSAITRCYSTALITCDGGNSGGVAGGGTATLTSAYYLAADSADNALSCSQLAALDLGDGWTAGDEYTYPRITSLASVDIARARAAAVVPAGGETYCNITTDFHIGVVDGVEWTATPEVVTLDGNTATFTADYAGTLTLTATCGQAAATTTLSCDVDIDGVSAPGADTRAVVSEHRYTIDGRPAQGNGGKGVHIVARTCSDGSVQVAKELR